MKKAAFTGAFMVVAALASTSSAEYLPATHWRCWADQLVGHPSDALESRTGFGRRAWAQDARNHYLFVVGNAAMANRFWQSWMTTEANEAALVNVDLYAVYEDPNNPATGIWVGPGPNNTGKWKATTYSTIRATAKELPNTVVNVSALCEAGCYTPDQELQFGDSVLPIAKAYENGTNHVTTLAPGATLDSLQLMVNDIARWTVDIAPATQEILTFRTKSGGELRVTTEHPVMTSEGVMKRASDLVVGESLVHHDGTPDPIASIDHDQVFTKVYNLRPKTTDLTSNILIAQGFLNGSARYQSEYLQYLNRVLLRKRVPVELVARRGVNVKRDELSVPKELAIPAPHR